MQPVALKPGSAVFVYTCRLFIGSYRKSIVEEAAPVLWRCVNNIICGIMASWRHASTFAGITPDKTLDSIETLATFYGMYPDGKWSRIGIRLEEELDETERNGWNS